MRVAYILSRFPLVTETFIVREFDAVNQDNDMEIYVLSLFSVPPGQPIHDVAKPWVQGARQARPGRSLVALAWWLAREPKRLLSVVGLTARDYVTSPRLLVRALVAVAAGAEHARLARARGVDHVHAHFASYPGLAAWTIHKLTGISFSFTPHAHDIFVHQRGLARRLGDARFAVAVSRFNRDFLQILGKERARIEVVRYGINLHDYPFTERTLPATGPVRGVCIASFKEYKGHRFLLEAMALGPAERIRVRLIGDGPLRLQLERRARELRLTDRIEFVGSLPMRAVQHELRRADFLVLPSIVQPDGDSEGLPNVLIEALAAGVPAVSTDVTGIPEIVIDGETGYAAPPADAEGLANALARMIQDPPEAQRRARAGRALVERNHDLRNTANRMADLFRGDQLG